MLASNDYEGERKKPELPLGKSFYISFSALRKDSECELAFMSARGTDQYLSEIDKRRREKKTERKK